IARQIVALEGPLVWNIKVHRIGGLTEACRIYRVAAECGARLWAGTMPESGIGSQAGIAVAALRSEEHTSELQSRFDLVCRLLLAPPTPASPTLSLHDALPI